MWQEDRGHLVVIQIQQSQVSHFTEGAGRDLRNPVLTEPELFKTGRQTCRNLFQPVLLCVQIQQCWDLLKDL